MLFNYLTVQTKFKQIIYQRMLQKLFFQISILTNAFNKIRFE